ncbi:lipopolysaccharide biosynthesis protein [uncultured Sphaerotilus sp.]|uniref:lipopolysaccharide biosynthesis protein n=1 Tax=uncultured Sphaerotilus sp. TaxID=474984 RepID=UPI0030CA2979
MSVRKTIVGILFGKVAQSVSRIALVPIIIATLGPESYGEWLLYSSITAWVMMSNMGVGSLIANEMSLKYFSDDLNGARESYTYGLHICAGILLVVGVISFVVVCGLHFAGFLDFTKAAAIVLLAVSVPVSFFAEVIGARLRLVNKNHIGGILSGVRAWTEPLLTIIFLGIAKNIVSLALAVFLSAGIHVVLTFIIARLKERSCHRKRLSPPFSTYIAIVRSGMGFMAFPLGNAIVFQGSLMVIAGVLGPMAVAVYGTTRTATRVVNQLLEVLNQAIWPQLTMLYAEGRNLELKQLWMRATLISASTALFAAIAFAIWGPELYRLWVRNSIEPNGSLFIILAIGIPLGATWSSAGILLLALNRQIIYGRLYFAGSVLFMVLAYMFSTELNLMGVALASCLFDGLMVGTTFILVARFLKSEAVLSPQNLK